MGCCEAKAGHEIAKSCGGYAIHLEGCVINVWWRDRYVSVARQHNDMALEVGAQCPQSAELAAVDVWRCVNVGPLTDKSTDHLVPDIHMGHRYTEAHRGHAKLYCSIACFLIVGVWQFLDRYPTDYCLLRSTSLFFSR